MGLTLYPESLTSHEELSEPRRPPPHPLGLGGRSSGPRVTRSAICSATCCSVAVILRRSCGRSCGRSSPIRLEGRASTWVDGHGRARTGCAWAGAGTSKSRTPSRTRASRKVRTSTMAGPVVLRQADRQLTRAAAPCLGVKRPPRTSCRREQRSGRTVSGRQSIRMARRVA